MPKHLKKRKKRFLLLIVIYLAFISLGLPDAILGAGWPDMYLDLHVPKNYAGIITMIIACGTIISSLLSSKIIEKSSVAIITTISIFITAIALLGFSLTHHFIILCFLALPLGIGAGSVDVGLNNYVALNYKAIHMNWLHCFWGIGAAIGPVIMAHYLSKNISWTSGYNTIGWIQIGIFLLLLVSIPLWKNNNTRTTTKEQKTHASFKKIWRIPGVSQALFIFFCYCSIETTFGLWGASYLVFSKGLPPNQAAIFVSLFYIGITAGRFLSGILTIRLSNKKLISIGHLIILLGIITLFLPYRFFFYIGFTLVGLGCAPIFPSLLHETPKNFGEQYSQQIIGIQMASAYIGITLMPFLFGKLASWVGYDSLLWFVGILLLIKILTTRKLHRIVKRNPT